MVNSLFTPATIYVHNAYVRDADLIVREAVAAEVRALMGRHRVSQTGLASVLGMSQSAMSRRLNGEQPFDLDELVKVARYFGVTLAGLLSDATGVWLKTAGQPLPAIAA